MASFVANEEPLWIWGGVLGTAEVRAAGHFVLTLWASSQGTYLGSPGALWVVKAGPGSGETPPLGTLAHPCSRACLPLPSGYSDRVGLARCWLRELRGARLSLDGGGDGVGWHVLRQLKGVACEGPGDCWLLEFSV